MTTISSASDIKTWIGDVRPDVVDLGLHGDLLDAIRAADHPPYGSDWSTWLNTHVPGLVDALGTYPNGEPEKD